MLREMVESDVERLYELYRDEEVTRYMEGLFPDIEEEREYMKNYYRYVYQFYGYGMWLICLKDGTVIGRAGIEANDKQEHVLGYMLGKKYQHKGYAYEACSAILTYAREELELNKIKAYVRKENKASIRLAEKLPVELILL